MVDVVTWEGHQTVFGGPVKGSRRSIDWLEYVWSQAGHFQVIQSAFNVGVEASAGTHDGDACYDLTRLDWRDWRESEHRYRALGGAAWYRFPPTFTDHIHCVVLGYVDPWKPPYVWSGVGVYIPGQVTDYYNRALGLAGQHDPGDDPTWHPDDIDATIAAFERWRKESRDMDLNDRLGPNSDDTVGDALRAALRTEQRVIKGNAALRAVSSDVDAIADALATARQNIAARDAAMAAELDRVGESVTRTKSRVLQAVSQIDADTPPAGEPTAAAPTG